MSEYIIQKETLDELANVINDKTGDSEAMTPAEMAEKIREELFKPSGTKRITANGLSDVRGYASADIDVPSDSPTIRPLSVSQNGVYTAPGSIDGYSPVTVGVMTGVGERATPGVYFLDLEGEVVETWPAAEVAGKTALPAIPVHERLIGQEWSWQLQTIKDYFVSYPNAAAYMRPVYKTASGLTEADITLTKMTGKTVTFNMVGTKDWGDGSSDSLTTHTYSAYGDYTIKCDGTSLPAGSITQYGKGGLFASDQWNAASWMCTALYIGESVTTIGTYSCGWCDSLKTVTIPYGVTSMRQGVFMHCGALENISLPRGMTWQKENVNNTFEDCDSLKNVTFPQGMTFIPARMFYQDYVLQFVTIPASVTELGSSAFEQCYSLVEITLPNSITGTMSETFYHCYALRWANVPAGVTILESTFNGCYSLQEIILPNGLLEIGQTTFEQCYSMRAPELPDSLTTIQVKAFSQCHSFAGKITMPRNIASIRWGAFQYTMGVREFDFTKCSSVPQLDNSTDTGSFGTLNGLCKIVVPAQLYDEWIADSTWSRYVNYVYPDGVLVKRYTAAANGCTTAQALTQLTTYLSCNVGDLLLATFITRDGAGYSIPEGWTLLGISEELISGSTHQRTGMAYKYATSASESFTLTQTQATRMYINLVAITGATGVTFNGFTTQTTGNTITAERPDGLVVWGVSSIGWNETTWPRWGVSESEIASVQLDISMGFGPRLLTALDQGTHESVTFTASPGSSGDHNIACGSCTITGIPNFWYVEEE